MSITQKRKSELVNEYAQSPGDTGSPEVQVAILTERIKNLTDHVNENKKGQPLAAWPSDDGEPAQEAAHLPPQHERGPLQGSSSGKLGLRR